jgi:hypothetical protein
MIHRNADPINSYSIASEIATSGLGYLYEDPQGKSVTPIRLTEPSIYRPTVM